jgi:hypothetical protein
MNTDRQLWDHSEDPVRLIEHLHELKQASLAPNITPQQAGLTLCSIAALCLPLTNDYDFYLKCIRESEATLQSTVIPDSLYQCGYEINKRQERLTVDQVADTTLITDNEEEGIALSKRFNKHRSQYVAGWVMKSCLDIALASKTPSDHDLILPAIAESLKTADFAHQWLNNPEPPSTWRKAWSNVIREKLTPQIYK